MYDLLGTGWIAAFIAGIAWLLALQALYKIGWIKSLIIAVAIWIVTTIVGIASAYTDWTAVKINESSSFTKRMR